MPEKKILHWNGWIGPYNQQLSISEAKHELEQMGIKVGPWDSDIRCFNDCTVSPEALAILEKSKFFCSHLVPVREDDKYTNALLTVTVIGAGSFERALLTAVRGAGRASDSIYLHFADTEIMAGQAFTLKTPQLEALLEMLRDEESGQDNL